MFQFIRKYFLNYRSFILSKSIPSTDCYSIYSRVFKYIFTTFYLSGWVSRPWNSLRRHSRMVKIRERGNTLNCNRLSIFSICSSKRWVFLRKNSM